MGIKALFSLADTMSRDAVGGKAYALSQMIQAGFTVPEGFVISSTLNGSMTEELNSEIFTYFDSLGAPLVAVRSSAGNEDGTGAAWAGQLDTFLNTTRETLLQNIERCWASAGSARAQAYAAQQAQEAGGVAVIVQKMIQSDVSGVAFSVHPITGNTAQIVIEAGLGLGEAVVSGQITPDTYITDKQSNAVLEKHIAQQHKLLAQDSSGATDWQEAGRAGMEQKLPDALIQEIAAVTARLETYFEYPVDVEWAVQAGKIYILQSRAITTLA